jgi:AraC-like DNA-binding protein
MGRYSRTDTDRYLRFGFASRREELRKRLTFNSHNEVEIAFVETGGVGLLLGGRLVRLNPGRLAFYWGAIPHAPVEVERETMYHWLTLPLTWFLEWQLPRDVVHAVLSGMPFIEGDDRQAREDCALLSRWHSDLQEGSVERRRIVLLECEARLRRLLLAAPAPVPSRARAGVAGRNPGKVERMSLYVALNYTQHLSVADIAQDAGLHPDYAASLFRKTCSVSLVDYVNEHRVSHAQRLLAITDAKIVEIAFRAGFGSASRFYSIFRKRCGLTPRKYRRQMGSHGSLFSNRSAAAVNSTRPVSWQITKESGH